MPVSATDLSSIDYGALIGGPMTAIIEAQYLSAQNAINLIKQNAFDSSNEPIYLDFKYERINADFDPANPSSGDPTVSHTLRLPYLLMLPNTFLTVESATIDFNAKINGVSYDKTTTNTRWGVDLSASAAWGWGRARLNASFAHQKKRAYGTEVQKTYSMNVKVQMAPTENDGLDKVFEILLDNVTSSLPPANTETE